MQSIVLLALVVVLAGCGAAPPRDLVVVGLPTRAVPVEDAPAARAAVERPRCAGVSLELERDGDVWSRRISLRCHDTGATLVLVDAHDEYEGEHVQQELDVATTEALWAELGGVSLTALRCAEEGPRRLRIEGPGGVRSAACDEAGSSAWDALEELLVGAARPDHGEVEIPWVDPEYWRDELRYYASRSEASTSEASSSEDGAAR